MVQSREGSADRPRITVRRRKQGTEKESKEENDKKQVANTTRRRGQTTHQMSNGDRDDVCVCVWCGVVRGGMHVNDCAIHRGMPIINAITKCERWRGEERREDITRKKKRARGDKMVCVYGKMVLCDDLRIFSPFIFCTYSFFFFWCKIILYIECFTNLFRCFTFDHRGNFGTCQI